MSDFMPENTTARDPLLHLLGAMSEGSSDYIMGMEAAGQRQLVESAAFPTEAPIAELEALGFVFGPVDAQDPMFRQAQLPPGWSRRATDHSMWSKIIDEKGRDRVSIFYKAAFYDRSAHASLVSPTMALWDLVYGLADGGPVPAALPIDDLLTADMARKWLTGHRSESVEWVRRFRESGQEQTAVERQAQVDAIDALLPLLPETSA